MRDGGTIYMQKRITQLSNLIEAIHSGMITINNVRSDTKLCTETKDVYTLTAEKFMDSIEFLNETVFKDAVDFYYDFAEDNTILRIECGLKNAYMGEVFYADCEIAAGVSKIDLEKLLRKKFTDMECRLDENE